MSFQDLASPKRVLRLKSFFAVTTNYSDFLQVYGAVHDEQFVTMCIPVNQINYEERHHKVTCALCSTSVASFIAPIINGNKVSVCASCATVFLEVHCRAKTMTVTMAQEADDLASFQSITDDELTLTQPLEVLPPAPSKPQHRDYGLKCGNCDGPLTQKHYPSPDGAICTFCHDQKNDNKTQADTFAQVAKVDPKAKVVPAANHRCAWCDKKIYIAKTGKFTPTCSAKCAQDLKEDAVKCPNGFYCKRTPAQCGKKHPTCAYGIECAKANCKGVHPDGWDSTKGSGLYPTATPDGDVSK